MFEQGRWGSPETRIRVAPHPTAEASKYSISDSPPLGAGYIYIITNRKKFRSGGDYNIYATYIGKTAFAPKTRLAQHLSQSIQAFPGSGRYNFSTNSPLHITIGTAFGRGIKNTFANHIKIDILAVHSLYCYNVAEAIYIKNYGLGQPAKNYREVIRQTQLNLRTEDITAYAKDSEWYKTSGHSRVAAYRYYFNHDVTNPMFINKPGNLFYYKTGETIKTIGEKAIQNDLQKQVDLLTDIRYGIYRKRPTEDNQMEERRKWENIRENIANDYGLLETKTLEKIYDLYFKRQNMSGADINVLINTLMSKPNQQMFLDITGSDTMIEAVNKLGSFVDSNIEKLAKTFFERTQLRIKKQPLDKHTFNVIANEFNKNNLKKLELEVIQQIGPANVKPDIQKVQKVLDKIGIRNTITFRYAKERAKRK
jgi:hypothetical protein